jgi:peroxiredoxin
VEEPTHIEGTPEPAQPPETSPPLPPPPPASNQAKLAAGALLALVLAAGLYYINRFWIAPAVRAQTKGAGDHPLAPEFSLTDITGKPLKLSDYQHKVVVVDFWATWCGPCQLEIPGFIDLQKRYSSQGFSMIGISMDDSSDPVVEYYKEKQMNYPVALGNDRLAELYGVTQGYPTTFVIGRDGRIYAKHVGAYDPAVFEEEVKELISADPSGEATNFKQVGQVFADDKVELGNPSAIDSEVPGIDLTKLTADQKEAYKKILSAKKCTCDCNRNLLECRHVDRNCSTSRKLAQVELDALLKGAPPAPAEK